MSKQSVDNQTIVMPALFADTFAKVVTKTELNTLLPKQFSDKIEMSADFEHKLYKYADNLSDDYEAGRWEFAQCESHNTFFMFPQDDSKTYAINDDEGEPFAIDNKLFGLIASLVALEEGSCRSSSDEQAIADAFYEQHQSLLTAIYETIDTMSNNPDTSEADQALIALMKETLETHTE